MGKIVEEVEGARLPTLSLLFEQLSDYADGNGTDLYLEHTLKEAYNLTREEKLFILTNFFHAHPEHMIRPYPRYAELEALRGDPYRVSDRIDAWSKQDYLDLQVWFNLTWFGQTIKDKDEEIQSFIRKGQGFSEADKQRLIEKQREVIGRSSPFIATPLRRSGELTTSPLPSIYRYYAIRTKTIRPDPQSLSCACLSSGCGQSDPWRTGLSRIGFGRRRGDVAFGGFGDNALRPDRPQWSGLDRFR